MSQLSDLLAKCEQWTADAAMAMHSLSVRRAALLKEAKRLKMVAACKAILVAPKMGGEEPGVAAVPTPPEPWPTVASVAAVETPDVGAIYAATVGAKAATQQDGAAGDGPGVIRTPTGAPVAAAPVPDAPAHQEGPLAIQKDIRR